MIDPIALKIAELHALVAGYGDETDLLPVLDILDTLTQRVIELERRNRNQAAASPSKAMMTCWVNVYGDGTLVAYESENSARQAANYFIYAPRPIRLAVPMQEVSCAERVLHTNKAGDTAKHLMHKEVKDV